MPSARPLSLARKHPCRSDFGAKLTTATSERWLPVVGSEGLHEVSDRGRVRSLARVSIRSNGRPYTVRGRVLRPGATAEGHRQVVLHGESEKVTRKVHSLVLEAFVGPRPDGLCGLHGDDDPDNNALDNLRWGTSAENAADSVRNGGHHCATKTQCKRGHELSGPNLAPYAPKGGRCCLACNRAKASSRHHGLADNEQYVQKLSDERYSVIMGFNE